MWLPVMGLITGLLIGSIFTFALPASVANYLSIAVLASLDSLLGGWRAVLENKFNGAILISGFFVNALTAAVLVFLGDLLGLDLKLAAVVGFGLRIFTNIGFIRRGIIQQWRTTQRDRQRRRTAAEVTIIETEDESVQVENATRGNIKGENVSP